jgi:acyl-coenzyme A thioesterase PaaI-like protein
MEDMLIWGRRILASQPFSVLLGAELLTLCEGGAELKVPLRAELKQQHGFIHGGVISYAADNALTYAGGSVLGPSVVTSVAASARCSISSLGNSTWQTANIVLFSRVLPQ